MTQTQFKKSMSSHYPKLILQVTTFPPKSIKIQTIEKLREPKHMGHTTPCVGPPWPIWPISSFELVKALKTFWNPLTQVENQLFEPLSRPLKAHARKKKTTSPHFPINTTPISHFSLRPKTKYKLSKSPKIIPSLKFSKSRSYQALHLTAETKSSPYYFKPTPRRAKEKATDSPSPTATSRTVNPRWIESSSWDSFHISL